MSGPYRTPPAGESRLEATLPRAKFCAKDVPILPNQPACPKCGSTETKYEYRAAFTSPSPEIWLSLIQNEYRIFGSFDDKEERTDLAISIADEKWRASRSPFDADTICVQCARCGYSIGCFRCKDAEQT